MGYVSSVSWFLERSYSIYSRMTVYQHRWGVARVLPKRPGACFGLQQFQTVHGFGSDLGLSAFALGIIAHRPRRTGGFETVIDSLVKS